MENAVIIGASLFGLYLLTRRWIWILAFWIGGLAAAFYALANIFHFQIIAAIGYWIVAAICWGIASAITEM